MDATESLLGLAERFSAAVVAADFDAFRSLTTPGCRVSYNYRITETESISREQAIANIARMRTVVREFGYRDVRRMVTADGFLQLHQVRCLTAGGVLLHVDVALLASVTDGLITTYREFLDSAHVAPVMRELLAAQGAR